MPFHAYFSPDVGGAEHAGNDEDERTGAAQAVEKLRLGQGVRLLHRVLVRGEGFGRLSWRNNRQISNFRKTRKIFY